MPDEPHYVASLFPCENKGLKSALRAPASKQLLAGGLHVSLFDRRDMASITTPEFPGERLVVCRHPGLATERELARIRACVVRKIGPLPGPPKPRWRSAR